MHSRTEEPYWHLLPGLKASSIASILQAVAVNLSTGHRFQAVTEQLGKLLRTNDRGREGPVSTLRSTER